MKRLLIIGPIAALAFAGCGGGSGSNSTPVTSKPSAPKTASAPPGGVEKDPVKLDDFKILPATTSLKAGKVEFMVRNTGKVAHEFVVIDTSKPAAALGHGKRIPEKGNIGETGNLKPGASKTLVLNLPKGHYAVVCNDPGHYMAGMHKDLTVS